MIEKDKKELRLMMCDVLEQIVLPKFDELENKMDGKFKKVDEKLDNIEERLETVEDTTTRIELKLNSVVARQDEQGDEIKDIKQVIGLGSKA